MVVTLSPRARKAFATAVLVLGGIAGAEGQEEGAARGISWADLLPKVEEPVDDPFQELEESQLLDLGMVARIRFLRDTGKLIAGGEDDDRRDLSLVDQGPLRRCAT